MYQKYPRTYMKKYFRYVPIPILYIAIILFIPIVFAYGIVKGLIEVGQLFLYEVKELRKYESISEYIKRKKDLTNK